MNRDSIQWACAAVCLVFSIASGFSEDNQKWERGDAISLFDGETLAGWKLVDYAGHGAVKAGDGLLELGMGSTLTGIVWQGEVPARFDYEIELEAKRAVGNDFFCGLTFPYRDQHATLILGGWGGSLTGFSSIDGLDASENESQDFMRFETDRWYRVRLRALEDRLQAWVDDQPIFDVETKGREIDVRIDVAEFTPIGLSSFQTTAVLRNLRWIPLTAVESAH